MSIRTTIPCTKTWSGSDFNARLPVHRTQFSAGEKIVASATIPVGGAKNIFRGEIVQVHGNAQHRAERQQIRADPSEAVAIVIRTDALHVFERGHATRRPVSL